MSNLLIQFDQQQVKSNLMSTISFHTFKLKYQFDCQLSQGSFGRVCRIQEIDSKKYFALKKVAVKKKQQLQDIQNQIQLLQRFRHPFVVDIKETYKIQIERGFSKPVWEVGLIMELAKCSLQHIIRMKKSIGTFQFIIEQVAGLIKILYILQKQNIAHRDIKPANILVFEKGDNTYHWKLADFGLSINLNKKHEQDNFAGSFQYASPILKRKFKYPNLKTKSNPFKDDTYSLGITLLQIITGYKCYNTIAYQRLRQLCTNIKLINLIDMMLEEDQQKRPCFKQLFIILEKDFNIAEFQQQQNKSYIQNNNINRQQKIMTKVKNINNYHIQQQQLSSQYDKTVLKLKNNDKITQNLYKEKNIRKNIIEIGKPIQCVASLNGVIMCGCDNGQILFVKNGDIITTGGIQVHKRFVSQLVDDRQGNILSIGGDNTIKIFHKTTLIKLLLSEIKPIEHTRNSSQKLKYSLQLKPSYYKTIILPFSHVSGISCIQFIDQNNFIVGYFDGYVYIKWDQVCGEFHGRMFGRPVTGIKIQKKNNNGNKKKARKVWFCGMEGIVKIFNLEQMHLENRIYAKSGCSFTNIFLQQASDINIQPTLNLLTLDGRQQILTSNLQPLFQTALTKPIQIISSLQLQKDPKIELSIHRQSQHFSSLYSNKNCFMLSVNGEIIDSNQQKIIQIGGQGWNCMANGGECQIIVGSFLGQISVIQWSLQLQ